MPEPAPTHSSPDELRALAPMLTEGSLLKALALQLIAEAERAAARQARVRVEPGSAA